MFVKILIDKISIRAAYPWIPAFARMTEKENY